jgi:hypothetical protein
MPGTSGLANAATGLQCAPFGQNFSLHQVKTRTASSTEGSSATRHELLRTQGRDQCRRDCCCPITGGLVIAWHERLSMRECFLLADCKR